MLKGLLDKLRSLFAPGPKAETAAHAEPDAPAEKAAAPEASERAAEVKAAAEDLAADHDAQASQAKTEVASPDHTPGLQETTQLDRKAVKELLRVHGVDGADSAQEAAPPKKSNYETLPETVQLDKKRVQEILRQAKAKDAQTGGEDPEVN